MLLPNNPPGGCMDRKGCDPCGAAMARGGGRADFLAFEESHEDVLLELASIPKISPRGFWICSPVFLLHSFCFARRSDSLNNALSGLRPPFKRRTCHGSRRGIVSLRPEKVVCEVDRTIFASRQVSEVVFLSSAPYSRTPVHLTVFKLKSYLGDQEAE